MNRALEVYAEALWRSPEALDYVRGRAIPDEITRECGLGFADGHSLLEALDGGALGIAERLGLLRRARRDGSRREFFAGRVVVPEIRAGNSIWLIGRTIAPNHAGPRYLALEGERPILGYERAAGAKEVFLCEGVFDWLTAISWGLPAFSPCGTSLPADRLGLLARAEIIWGVLNGDDAGEEAARRFASQLGDRFRAVALPRGRDLNDLATSEALYEDLRRLFGSASRPSKERSSRLSAHAAA